MEALKHRQYPAPAMSSNTALIYTPDFPCTITLTGIEEVSPQRPIGEGYIQIPTHPKGYVTIKAFVTPGIPQILISPT